MKHEKKHFFAKTLLDKWLLLSDKISNWTAQILQSSFLFSWYYFQRKLDYQYSRRPWKLHGLTTSLYTWRNWISEGLASKFKQLFVTNTRVGTVVHCQKLELVRCLHQRALKQGGQMEHGKPLEITSVFTTHS